MSNEKRKDIYIMILSAFLVIVSIVAILFFIESRSVKETLVAKEQEYKSNLGNLNNDSATKVENTITEKEVEKIVEKKVEVPVSQIINFDRTKAKKVREGVVYGNISTTINASDLCISSNINKEGEFYIDEKKVNGLNVKVVDAVVGNYGDGASGYAVLLKEDGTVSYISDENIHSNNISITGTIEGVNNIVKIIYCETTGTTNCGRAFIAIDKDGYFYDVIAMAKGQIK